MNIYGSILPAVDKVYWVHAPHCHALPVIRTTKNAVIELHPAPHAQGLKRLERLNPVFGKLWNESSTKVAILTKAERKLETFQIVRHLAFPSDMHDTNTGRFSLQRMALRRLSTKILSHPPNGTKN